MKLRATILRAIMFGICLSLLLIIGGSPSANAGESAFSNYLPGFRDTLAGILPPPGTYLKQFLIYYSGDVNVSVSERRIERSSQIDIPATISALSYVTKQKIGSGRLAYGIIIPAARVHVSGNVVAPVQGSFSQSTTSIGDIELVPIVVGWNEGYSHHKVQLEIYVPTGNYNVNRQANTGLNRWAIEFDYAYTWLNLKNGLEISVAPGYTIPFKNSATDYLSGQELHIDYAIVQRFPSRFGFGVAGYLFQQTTGDSGSGALLGPFKARVYGIGPIITYAVKNRNEYIHLAAKYITEFNAKNRFEGQSGWVTAYLEF